jgi:hypothetical protein
LLQLIATDYFLDQFPFTKAFTLWTTMEDILLVENPIVAAADRNIQSKLRDVFRSSHIDLLSASTLPGGAATVCSRMHSCIEEPT